MKRCSTCNKTFEEDWLSFCTDDGTVLVDESSAPAEPPPTIMSPSLPDAVPNEQATWNLPSSQPAPAPWQPAPPPVSPGWQPPPPPSYVQPQNRSLATAAMVIGIISITVGWLCLGPIPAIVAIVLGGVALSQIKKSPDRIGGKQFAWIGIVTGGVTVVIYTGFLILYIVGLVAMNS